MNIKRESKNIKHKTQNTKKDYIGSEGFSLIEVLIATVIMGILVAGISSALQSQFSSVAYMDDKLSHQNLAREIQNLLSLNPACTNSFKNIILPAANSSVNFTQIKDHNDNVIYDTTNSNANKYDRLTIVSAAIENLDISTTSPSGRLNIRLGIERNRSGGGPKQLQNINFPLVATVDTSGANLKLSSCYPEKQNGKECLRPYSLKKINRNGGNLIVPSDVKAIRFYQAIQYESNLQTLHKHDNVDVTVVQMCIVPELDIYIDLSGDFHPNLVAGKSIIGSLVKPSDGRIGGSMRFARLSYNGVPLVEVGHCFDRGRNASFPYHKYFHSHNINICATDTDPSVELIGIRGVASDYIEVMFYK